MIPNSTHVVTRGSNVWLDADNGRYLRLPLEERGRERAEWSDERAGVLQDAVWHPMVDWAIAPFPDHDPQNTGICSFGSRCHACPGLIIDYIDSDGAKSAWFPNAAVVR